MNNIDKIKQLFDEEKFPDVAEMILSLPENEQHGEVLDILVSTYLNLDAPDYAEQIMERLEEEIGNSFYWHMRMGIIYFYQNKYDEAKEEIAKSLELNPPNEDAATCFAVLNAIENHEKKNVIELYEDDELEIIDKHIEEFFGKCDTVLHELASPDIHCDIYVINPTEEKNYYTLITVGMGAHRMNVPEELTDRHLSRAELVIYLPPNWEINNDEQNWYWPIGLLKSLARLPIHEDGWIGWGHTIGNDGPYADNTKFCSCMLAVSENSKEGSSVCKMADGSEINFYMVMPLYKEEEEYKCNHTANILLRSFWDQDIDINLADPARKNACEMVEDNINLALPLDTGLYHTAKVGKNNFPLDEIVGLNHMSIYLRWCIEHDMMCEDFCNKYADVIADVKDKKSTDLRVFIKDNLDGNLTYQIFNTNGLDFAKYYYSAYNGGDEDSKKHCFPCDIDDYAEKFLGSEKYHCEEYKDEAYLFVPFDEVFYKGMKKYLDKNYKKMLKEKQ